MVNITVKDGLSQGMITAIIQDNKGEIWIGTKDGLNKFNGYKFKIIRKTDDDNNSLPGN